MTLINDFHTLGKDTQLTILNTLRGKLNEDPSFFQQALTSQVKSLAGEARRLYESKEQVKLIALLDSVSPMAAILLNIEMAHVNDHIMEEGNTLSQTLLPYINGVTDFSFLCKDSDFYLCRFLAALTCHIKDTQKEVGVGFMILALKMNPTLIPSIVQFHTND